MPKSELEFQHNQQKIKKPLDIVDIMYYNDIMYQYEKKSPIPQDIIPYSDILVNSFAIIFFFKAIPLDKNFPPLQERL